MATVGMENLCEDVFVEILRRLRDDKEVVRCMSVSKSWRSIISSVLRLRFWEQSPVDGLYFRTFKTKIPGTGGASRSSPTSERLEYLGDMVSHSDLQHINYVAVPLRAHHECYPDANRFFMDCCNGLLLLFDLKYEIYYVWNPYTRQRADLPKPVHDSHRNNILCAALAFDTAESSFYRVVLISRCTYLESDDDYCWIDIFSSKTGIWNRTKVKLDPFFIQDYSNSKLMVPRVYLRGVLHRMASSRKISRIDISSDMGATNRGPIDLPPIPAIDRTVVVVSLFGIDDWGVMGRLGVSMNCLSYCKREWTTFGVWLYHEQSGEWILRHTVSFIHLNYIVNAAGLTCYHETIWFEAVAVGPNSDVMFFGFAHHICSYNFKTKELKLVFRPRIFTPVEVVGCFFPVFTFRRCLLPFQGVDKRSVRFTPLHVAYSSREISIRRYNQRRDDLKLLALMEKLSICGPTQE